MPYDETTGRVHRFAGGLRTFSAAESASALVLGGAVVAALVWSTTSPGGYESLWSTHLTLTLGDHELAQSLRAWVNSGLMTIFFLVVGLEARREFDLGDLRERRRLVLPCAAGMVGMLVPALLYLVILRGHEDVGAWGMVISTDTALALGLLSLVGRGLPEQLRIFLVTVFVVDDVVALLPAARSGPRSAGPASWGAGRWRASGSPSPSYRRHGAEG